MSQDFATGANIRKSTALCGTGNPKRSGKKNKRSWIFGEFYLKSSYSLFD